MRIPINLRQLETKTVALKGELNPSELELEELDELIHVSETLKYDLEAEKIDQSVLVQGTLTLPLDCECARCLRPVRHLIEFAPWICHIPLEGPDKAEVINDSVDLTPYIREDILLEFPQHPLCEPDCGGLPAENAGTARQSNDTSQNPESSPWSELNKLKL
jgi:uncharacterized protein